MPPTQGVEIQSLLLRAKLVEITQTSFAVDEFKLVSTPGMDKRNGSHSDLSLDLVGARELNEGYPASRLEEKETVGEEGVLLAKIIEMGHPTMQTGSRGVRVVERVPVVFEARSAFLKDMLNYCSEQNA